MPPTARPLFGDWLYHVQMSASPQLAGSLGLYHLQSQSLNASSMAKKITKNHKKV